MTLIEKIQNLEQLSATNELLIAEGEAMIKKMTKKGCQAGKAHFKTDRPNTMYILEPSINGKRQYIHVGTDEKQQEIKQKEIKRHAARDHLMRIVGSWKRETEKINALIVDAERSAKALRKDAEQWLETAELYL